MYQKEIKCSFQVVTETEALNNSILGMKDYKRPRIIGSSGRRYSLPLVPSRKLPALPMISLSKHRKLILLIFIKLILYIMCYIKIITY